MPSVNARIDVSVDTGDLDQQVGAQVAQLQQIVQLIIQLVDDPPNELGDFLDLAANLPLPEFSIDADFANAIDTARNALPANIGDLSAALDGDLDLFEALSAQLGELVQDSVQIAAAIEKLTSIDFTCPQLSNNTGSSPPPPPPTDNPAADRMTRTADQTQQVNDLIDRLPASLTVGGLIEFFFPLIDGKAHDKLSLLPIPVLDDIIEPLRTLSRWSAGDATAIGTEIEATLTTLGAHLRATGREPIDTLSADLIALQPQLNIVGLSGFADAYANALAQLLSAVESADTAAIGTATSNLNQALDDAAATLSGWDNTLSGDLEALCERLDEIDELLLDRASHLLSILEPVDLPAQLIDAIPTPQAPDAAAIAAVQEAVQPILDWLEDLLEMFDFSALQGGVSSVAGDAQALANSVDQALNGVALEVQSLFDELGEQLDALDLTGVQAQLDTQIQQFGGQLERNIGNAFSPASNAISTATQTLSDALDDFDPETVIEALRSVLQTITSVLESGEIADAIDQVRNAIQTVTETLEQLSFTPITDEVVALIEQMADALQEIQDTDLNAAAQAALSVALEVLPDDLTPITDPLLEDFDELIANGPVPLLEKVAAKPAELLDTITQFQPGTLIGPKLSEPYRAALESAEAFQPSQLFDAVDSTLQEAKQKLVQQAAPGQALVVLAEPFNQLKNELQQYSPDTVLAPLEEKIEGAIEKVVEASPVDEVFDQVNRVFALVEQALAVPNNLLATLQKVDAVFTQLADPDTQIDSWRDAMLDKLVAMPNIASITTVINDLVSALDDSTHAVLLDQFRTQTQALQTELESFDATARTTSLTSVHNRARSLLNQLPDSPEKSAATTALDRFDPSREAPLQLTRQLQQCLAAADSSLTALQAEWVDLIESPDSLLAEIRTMSSDTNSLRTLLNNALEPLLKPIRYVFSLLESVHPVLQAMLTTLTALVNQLTTGVAALTTGPASLQTITDAVQQIVDTLRNIDIGFLRESLQQLFIQVLDQLDAIDPAQLGASLDEAFESLVDSIGLDQIIDPADIILLDDGYQTVLEKLRALDPEQLITNVVQPEYDATVVPIVEAFDLSPAFNALIEFLNNLSEELSGELGRVNSAYQGLRAARPGGSVSVNVSL